MDRKRPNEDEESVVAPIQDAGDCVTRSEHRVGGSPETGDFPDHTPGRRQLLDLPYPEVVGIVDPRRGVVGAAAARGPGEGGYRHGEAKSQMTESIVCFYGPLGKYPTYGA